ncbi:MAG TPA: DUF4142 domain-containing protein [Dongiaceae bacterium]|nr:DUF4142 domain-containing protein [Dongiaceae bacterium]
MPRKNHKDRNFSFLLADAFLLLFLSVPLLALGQSSSSSADSKFAAEAAQGGMAEVKMGQLAQQNGSSDAVRSFGRRMEQDHTKAGEELKRAAQAAGITLPADLSTKDQAMYDELAKLKGTQFDRAYARAMVRDHEGDVKDFEKESQQGQNDSIRSFATQTLPTLRDHLNQARRMQQTVSAT